MRTVDLFCSCGGLSLGFTQAGYTILAAYDAWDVAVQTYNANFTHPALLRDIQELDVSELQGYAPEIIIGGPPCQDFSSAGKRDETRGRAVLTQVFAEKVVAVRPQWFVMENVERIFKSPLLTEVKETLRNAGYGLTQVVLDASLCGVPQKRKRFFLIGGLGQQDDFLLQDLIQGQVARPLTVREYMGDELDVEHYYRHSRSYLRRGVFSIDEPSPTIRGVNRPIPPGYPSHEGDSCKDLSKVRPLTLQERARIQTFPRVFVFLGSKTNQEQMIGNAVPVNLAQYVAQTLLAYVQRNSK